MDVFAIEKGKALKLSVDEFEKQTCHDYPYYRTNKDKRLSLYMRFVLNVEIQFRLSICMGKK